MGTIFSGGLIHIQFSSEYLWEQDGVCESSVVCVFMVMIITQCNSL